VEGARETTVTTHGRHRATENRWAAAPGTTDRAHPCPAAVPPRAKPRPGRPQAGETRTNPEGPGQGEPGDIAPGPTSRSDPTPAAGPGAPPWRQASGASWAAAGPGRCPGRRATPRASVGAPPGAGPSPRQSESNVHRPAARTPSRARGVAAGPLRRREPLLREDRGRGAAAHECSTWNVHLRNRSRRRPSP